MTQISENTSLRKSSATIRFPQDFVGSTQLKRPRIGYESAVNANGPVTTPPDNMAVNYDETINAFVEKIRSVKKENDALRADNMSYRDEMKTLREEAKVTKQNYESVQDKVFKYKEQFLIAREECVDTINDLNMTNSDRVNLQQKLKNTEDDHNSQVEAFEKKITELTSEISKLKLDKNGDVFESKLIELRDSNAVLVSEVEQLRDIIKEKNRRLDDITSENASLCEGNEHIGELKNKITEYVEQIQVLENKYELTLTEIDSLQCKIAESETDSERKRNELMDVNGKLLNEIIISNNKLLANEESLKVKNTVLASETDRLDDKIKDLEMEKKQSFKLLNESKEETNAVKMQLSAEIERLKENVKKREAKDKAEILNINKLNEKLKSELEKKQKENFEKEKEMTKLNNDIKTEQSSNLTTIKNMETKNMTLKREIDKLKRVANEKDAKLNELHNKLSAIEEKTFDLEKINTVVNKKLDDSLKKCSRLQDDLKRKDSDLAALKERLGILLENQNSSKDVTENLCENLKEDKNVLEDTSISQKAALKRLTSENDLLTVTVANMNEKLSKLHKQVEEIMVTNERLVNTLEQERANHKKTERYLHAERLANTELAEDFHSRKIEVKVNANKDIVRQQVQHQLTLQRNDTQQLNQFDGVQPVEKYEVHRAYGPHPQLVLNKTVNSLQTIHTDTHTLDVQQRKQNQPQRFPAKQQLHPLQHKRPHQAPPPQQQQQILPITLHKGAPENVPQTNSTQPEVHTLKKNLDSEQKENSLLRSHLNGINTIGAKAQQAKRETAGSDKRTQMPQKRTVRSQPDGESAKQNTQENAQYENQTEGLPEIHRKPGRDNYTYASRNKHIQKLKSQKKW